MATRPIRSSILLSNEPTDKGRVKVMRKFRVVLIQIEASEILGQNMRGDRIENDSIVPPKSGK